MHWRERLRRVPTGTVLLFVVLGAGLGMVGRVYYRWEERQVKRAAGNELSTIAKMKVAQIQRWRRERAYDAETLRRGPIVSATVDPVLRRETPVALPQRTAEFLEVFRQYHDYEQIAGIDRGGTGRFSLPGGAGALSPQCTAAAAEALRSGNVTFSDLHESEGRSGAQLCLAGPIPPPAGRGPAAGAVVLRMAPERYLFPALRSWPTASPTGETLLVKREGDEVVYLNELRHRKGTALKLRLPAGREGLLAGVAVKGWTGVVEGRDYRGEAALAAVMPVSGTPWYLVAKIDLEEVHAPLRERAGWLILMTGLLITAAGATTALVWRHHRVRVYRQKYEAEQQRRAVLDTALGGFVMLSTKGRIEEVNDAFSELTGYSRGELLGMRVQDIDHQFTTEQIRQHIGRIMESGGLRYESSVRRKDGRVIAVEASVTFLPQDGGRLVAFWRDITKRKRAEEALRESQEALARSREELRALTASLLSAQEEERRRVSRELHDDLNQRMAVLAMQVDMLAARLPLPVGELRRELESLEKQIAGLSDDVRRMASQLHPSVLEHLGLAVALRSHCERFSSREGIPVKFEERSVPADLPPEVALCLYRIAQEALHNLSRHARATQGSVILAGSDGGIALSITDDGVGFDPQAVRAGGGLGLLSMEERARLAGGTLAIRSSPGQGTRVEARVPAW